MIRNIFVLLFSVLFIGVAGTAIARTGDDTIMTLQQSDNKDIIRTVFRRIIEADSVDDDEIARYFSPDYIQHVDGKTLGYREFVNHLHLQRQTIASMEVKFMTLIGEGDIVFSRHLISARKKDGTLVQATVLAEFTIADGKITTCNELTWVSGGTAADRDLGSKH